MRKLIVVVIAGMFGVGSLFAGNGQDCTKQASNKEDQAACQVSLTTLNLTAEQKTKMDAIVAEHHEAGCNAASEAKYIQEAKTVLTSEQYAKFESQCSHHGDKNTKT